MRPGWKTTEFWLAVAAAAVGFTIASGAFLEGGQIMRGMALIASALASAGYSHSRGQAKQGDE